MALIAALFAYGIFELLLYFNFNFGRSKRNARTVHVEEKSRLGGLGIHLPILLYLIFFDSISIELFTGYLVIISVGFLDDLYDLSAKFKLVVQILVASVMVQSGCCIENVPELFYLSFHSVFFDYLVSIFLIVGFFNAINMMDGIDGLLGAYSLVTFVGLLVTYYMVLGLFNDFLLIIVACLILFLKYNLNPSRLFMGDSGSLGLAYLLAMNTFMLGSKLNAHFDLYLLLVLFLIPCYDALRVMIIRFKNGKNLMKADSSHFHHILLDVGFNHMKVVVRIVLIQFCAILWILMLFVLKVPFILGSLVTVVFIFCVFEYYYIKSKYYWRRNILDRFQEIKKKANLSNAFPWVH